ncbi:MAG: paraquat-inducible protein A [Algicola sp.]|nr:paraquat-inducible protein A [Algicola sp.]
MKSALLPIILLLGSLALLIPGITQPMLTITGTMDKAQLKETGIDILAESMVGKDDTNALASKERVKQMISGVTRMMGMSNITGEFEAYKKTRSISGTVKDLYDSGDMLVAFLVMLFSIVIPAIKILMMLSATLMRHSLTRQRLLTINSLLSKWSMADVFVVALIVTYMAANASGAGGLLTFSSNFEPGFYYFLGYCVFSIGASQLVLGYLGGDSVVVDESNEALRT